MPWTLALILLAACGGEENGNETAGAAPEPETTTAPVPIEEALPLDPPAPGEPGGLPDDGTPASEAPFAPESAQGAADVVQTYFAHIEERAYADAWRLWSDEGNASGMSAETFAASFAKYREYHANVGTPGVIEGAAGSLYVQVPVQAYGRLADGTPFNMAGPVTLRRVNDVPGSTAAQRSWHIHSSELKPKP